jgi:hypothetical protein
MQEARRLPHLAVLSPCRTLAGRGPEPAIDSRLSVSVLPAPLSWLQGQPAPFDGYKRIAVLQQLGRYTVEAGRLAGERGRGPATGPFAAFVRTRDRAGAEWLTGR